MATVGALLSRGIELILEVGKSTAQRSASLAF